MANEQGTMEACYALLRACEEGGVGQLTIDLKDPKREGAIIATVIVCMEPQLNRVFHQVIEDWEVGTGNIGVTSGSRIIKA